MRRVIVEPAAEVPDAVGSFLVDRAVVVAAVAANEHATCRNRDSARPCDGRCDARGHVVAVHVLEQRDLVAELHRGDAVLHLHVDAHGITGSTHERLAKDPLSAAEAPAIEQRGIRAAALGWLARQYDEVRAIDRDADPEEVVGSTRGFRQCLRRSQAPHFSPRRLLESGQPQHDQRDEADAATIHGELPERSLCAPISREQRSAGYRIPGCPPPSAAVRENGSTTPLARSSDAASAVVRGCVA